MNNPNDAVARFFQLNEEERGKYTRTTWRCRSRGHVLGYSLYYRSSVILLAQVKVKNSGYNAIPIPAEGVGAYPGLTLETVRGWSFAEFLELWEADKVTSEDLDRLYRLEVEPKGKTVLYSYLVEEDFIDGDKVRVGCGCYGMLAHTHPLRNFDKQKIIITEDELNERVEPLGPDKYRIDGVGVVPMADRFRDLVKNISTESLEDRA